MQSQSIFNTRGFGVPMNVAFDDIYSAGQAFNAGHLLYMQSFPASKFSF